MLGLKLKRVSKREPRGTSIGLDATYQGCENNMNSHRTVLKIRMIAPNSIEYHQWPLLLTWFNFDSPFTNMV